jgi:hypothetical protein
MKILMHAGSFPSITKVSKSISSVSTYLGKLVMGFLDNATTLLPLILNSLRTFFPTKPVDPVTIDVIILFLEGLII